MSKEEYQIGDSLEKESNIEALKEIKEDGYKLLNYIDNSTDVVIKKAHNLFQIILVIISALIGFIINIITKVDKWTEIHSISLISCVLLLVILSFLYKLAYSTLEFSAIGYQPKNSFKDYVFQFKSKKKNQKELLRYNIQCIQRDIDINLGLHQQLVSRFEKITKYIVIVAIGMLLAILFTYCLSPFLLS